MKSAKHTDPQRNNQVKCKDDVFQRRVAFYLNYVLGSPPLELHIASIKDMLSRGNDVTIYYCDGQLSACTANPFHSFSICNYCRYRTDSALKSIDASLVNVRKVDFSFKHGPEDLKDATASLELGVMSSMASAVKAQTREQLNPAWTKVHDRMLDSARHLYSFFLDEISRHGYDYVFMFNGRFGDVKPVLEAARSTGTGYGLYEVKKSLHEVFFVNELVHSIDGNTRRALASYISNPQAARDSAALFFDKKEKNEDTGDPVYTQNQMQGELPDAVINTNRIVVAVYPTTDDEYKFIGKEWDGFVPEDQVVEIDNLSKALDSERFLIVVKMHPNQATTAENIISRYKVLQEQYSHVVVEEPLSKKDTYALMRRADYIVNFASTIGVEACYARKIVIAIGDTTFSKMNIAYKTKSGQEAALLIMKGGLKAKPVRGAIIWGNYLSTYADSLPSFSRISNGDYRIDGNAVGRSVFLRALQLPAKFRLEVSKPGFKFGYSFLLDGFLVLRNILLRNWSVK